MPKTKSNNGLLSGHITIDKRVIILLVAAMVGFGVYAAYQSEAHCGSPVYSHVPWVTCPSTHCNPGYVYSYTFHSCQRTSH
ncbi:MAG TPA: hypothetical protein VLF41_03310 [Candidatus Nanoarchaeia archaeon]|nr:hypothetical protein [Candidatus Nanoarchaeia archaeon]